MLLVTNVLFILMYRRYSLRKLIVLKSIRITRQVDYTDFQIKMSSKNYIYFFAAF